MKLKLKWLKNFNIGPTYWIWWKSTR